MSCLTNLQEKCQLPGQEDKTRNALILWSFRAFFSCIQLPALMFVVKRIQLALKMCRSGGVRARCSMVATGESLSLPALRVGKHS